MNTDEQKLAEASSTLNEFMRGMKDAVTEAYKQGLPIKEEATIIILDIEQQIRNFHRNRDVIVAFYKKLLADIEDAKIAAVTKEEQDA